MQGKFAMIKILTTIIFKIIHAALLPSALIIFSSVITVMIKGITAKRNSQRKRCVSFFILVLSLLLRLTKKIR